MRLGTHFFFWIAATFLVAAIAAGIGLYELDPTALLDLRAVALSLSPASVYWATGISSASLVIIYFIFWCTVARPLRRMSRQMVLANQRSKYDCPLPESKRNDDIGVAALAFNHLAGLVQQGLNFLRDANDQLENRVLHRTSDLASKNAQLHKDIAQHKATLANCNDRAQILEMVARDAPFKAILETIISSIERHRPGLRSSVLRMREGVLHLAAAPTLPEDYRRAIDVLPVSADACTPGLAIHHQKNIITHDIASDPAWLPHRALTQQHKLAACFAIPIFSINREILGALVTYADRPSSPTSTDLAHFESCAALTAIAIEHQHLCDKLAFQATHDPLTGLPNRALLEDRLQQSIATAERAKEQLGVFFIDIDGFKLINETLGHATGDLLLREIAIRMRDRVRKVDTLVRMGGDEFTLVTGGLKTRRGASEVAAKLMDTLKSPFEIAGHTLQVTASIGVSLFPEDGTDSATLQRNADFAMYRAKGAGRNRCQFFDPVINENARERIILETQLRSAIDNDELELHYQPRVDRHGQIVGVEALVRWRHPTLGLVPPVRFIPLAEESGMIVPLGAWVLNQACLQCKQWQRDGHTPIRMGVNVSALQFAQADFTTHVIAALAAANLDPALLELEVTESLLMRDMNDTAAKLHEVRALGVGIAIDDFGTGYSSLSYLQRLPIDTLKIDRSFVQEVKNMPATGELAIVRAIASLAKTLNMRVIAEGIETPVQRDFLLSIGCDGLQGYLFSPPKPAREIERLLSAPPFQMTEPQKASA